jgi:hypothetical protein
VQTLQGLQVGGLGGKQTIVINKSGGQTIRYPYRTPDPSLRRRSTSECQLLSKIFGQNGTKIRPFCLNSIFEVPLHQI